MPNPLNKRTPWYGNDNFQRYPRTAPLIANFTQVNTFATAQDRIGRLTLEVSSIPSGSAGCLRVLARTLQATPYTIDFCGVAMGDATGITQAMVGLTLYDGTKAMTCYGGGFTNAPAFRVLSWGTTTTATATIFSRTGFIGGPVYWTRITDDGTTRRYFGSATGSDWFQIGSEATNTFLTPTQYGICFFNNGGTVAKASVYHLSIQTGIIGDEP